MSQYFVKLHVKHDNTSKFWCPHLLPFALKDGIKRELDKLQSAGIIEPIVFSEWAAPTVAVPKKPALYVYVGNIRSHSIHH